jgi:hypothetical protein
VLIIFSNIRIKNGKDGNCNKQPNAKRPTSCLGDSRQVSWTKYQKRHQRISFSKDSLAFVFRACGFQKTTASQDYMLPLAAIHSKT